LRDRAGWVEAGVSFLVGTDANRMVQVVKFIEDNYDLIKGGFRENPFGDGCAARRIVDIVMRFI
jgi:UDP-N-acetylglucosamine 2-epimerase